MKSTQAMRDRIRELMSREQDDYDRAVECVLDDLEGILAVAQAVRIPKVRTSHHRNKEEAARLQALVDKRCLVEQCAKIADDFAAYEQTVLDRAHADDALSETGRKSIVSAAGSRQVAAEQIAYDIRALAVSSTMPSPAADPTGDKPSGDCPPASAAMGLSAAGEARCPVCDWTMADSWEKGCIPGNCSYRPDDPAEQERIRRRRAQLSSTDKSGAA